MARFFISTGHSSSDPGAVAHGTTEHIELNKIIPSAIQLARPHLKSGDELIVVPAVLGFVESTQWALARMRAGDYFTEIHLNSNVGTPGTGSEIWVRVSQTRARLINDGFVRGMRRRWSNWVNRGEKTTTAFYVTNTFRTNGSIAELAFLNNATDLSRIRSEGVKALAEALLTVSHGKATPVPQPKPAVTRTKRTLYTPVKKFKFNKDARLVEIPSGSNSPASVGKVSYKKGEELSAIHEYSEWSNGKKFYRTKFSVDNNITRGFLTSVLTEVKPPAPTPPPPAPPKPVEPKHKLTKLEVPLELKLRRDAHLVSPENDFKSVGLKKSGDEFRAFATFETDRKYYVTEWSYIQWEQGKAWNAVEADALTYPDEHQLKEIEIELKRQAGQINALEAVVMKIVEFLRQAFGKIFNV